MYKGRVTQQGARASAEDKLVLIVNDGDLSSDEIDSNQDPSSKERLSGPPADGSGLAADGSGPAAGASG